MDEKVSHSPLFDDVSLGHALCASAKERKTHDIWLKIMKLSLHDEALWLSQSTSWQHEKSV